MKLDEKIKADFRVYRCLVGCRRTDPSMGGRVLNLVKK